MSRYVQTFSRRDQAILKHPFFSFSAPPLTIVEEEQPLNSLWLNLGCFRRSFPDPNQDLPRIRRTDIIAFREIWLESRPPIVNLPGPVRGFFSSIQWNQFGDGYVALVLAYRTFGLYVYSDTPYDAVKFTTIDVDHVLTNCLEGCHGDEMPTCDGTWARGAARVRWVLRPVSKRELERIIKRNKEVIDEYIQKELVKQCDITIALRRLYKPEVSNDVFPVVLPANVASNAALGLHGVFARLGISLQMVLSLPGNGVLALEYAQYSVPELEDLFMISRGRSNARIYEYFQIPELPMLLDSRVSSGN